MSTDPDTWGPHGWKFLHFVALGYPNHPTLNDAEKYKHFFYLFGDMIPCSICANHYKKNLKEINIDLYLLSKNDLLKWTILMHNEVNKSNGKKIYTFNEGIDMIIDGQGPINCSYNKIENNDNNIKYLILFLIIIILIQILYIYKKIS